MWASGASCASRCEERGLAVGRPVGGWSVRRHRDDLRRRLVGDAGSDRAPVAEARLREFHEKGESGVGLAETAVVNSGPLTVAGLPRGIPLLSACGRGA